MCGNPTLHRPSDVDATHTETSHLPGHTTHEVRDGHCGVDSEKRAAVGADHVWPPEEVGLHLRGWVGSGGESLTGFTHHDCLECLHGGGREGGREGGRGGREDNLSEVGKISQNTRNVRLVNSKIISQY